MNYSDQTYDHWLTLKLDFTDNFTLYELADYKSAIWQQFFKRIDEQMLPGIDLFLNNLRPQHQVAGKDMQFLMDILALLNRPKMVLTDKQKLKTAITLIKNWDEVMVPSQREYVEFSVTDYINTTGLGTTISVG